MGRLEQTLGHGRSRMHTCLYERFLPACFSQARSGKHGPEPTNIDPNLVRFGPGSTKFCPESTKFGPQSSNMDLNSSEHPDDAAETMFSFATPLSRPRERSWDACARVPGCG